MRQGIGHDNVETAVFSAGAALAALDLIVRSDDAPVYGGLFTSDLVLDEPGRPDIYRQWFDFMFLGLDGHSIWNASITTGNLQLWDRVEKLAAERTHARLSETELDEEFRWEFSPAFHVGRQKYFRVTRPEPSRHAALEGLTVREYEERTASEILRNTPPEGIVRFAMAVEVG